MPGSRLPSTNLFVSRLSVRCGIANALPQILPIVRIPTLNDGGGHVKTAIAKRFPFYRGIQRRRRTLADSRECYPIGKGGMREQPPSTRRRDSRESAVSFAPIHPAARCRRRVPARFREQKGVGAAAAPPRG